MKRGELSWFTPPLPEIDSFVRTEAFKRSTDQNWMVTVKSPSFRPELLSIVRKLTGEHASRSNTGTGGSTRKRISKQGGTVGG